MLLLRTFLQSAANTRTRSLPFGTFTVFVNTTADAELSAEPRHCESNGKETTVQQHSGGFLKRRVFHMARCCKRVYGTFTIWRQECGIQRIMTYWSHPPPLLTHQLSFPSTYTSAQTNMQMYTNTQNTCRRPHTDTHTQTRKMPPQRRWFSAAYFACSQPLKTSHCCYMHMIAASYSPVRWSEVTEQLHSTRPLFQFAKLVCWRRATMAGDTHICTL